MSTINVTNLSGRGGATPNLPDGANITGVATASGGFSGNSVDVSIAGGGGGGIGTVVTFEDASDSPFSYINPEYILEKNITFDTTNAGAGYSSIVVSTIPTITVKSGVGMTVGVGKTLVIDVLQIGEL